MLEIIRDCCLLGQRHGEVMFRPFFKLIFASGSCLEPFATSEMDIAYLGQGRHIRGRWGSGESSSLLVAVCNTHILLK